MASAIPLLLIGALLSPAQHPTHFTELTSSHEDLLSGGLGFTGLRSPTPPAFTDPDHPTSAELRRRALWTSAGLWAGDGGGLGRLYGADVEAGRPVPGDGRVPGVEYRAVADGVSFLVQIPDRLDRTRPCVVAAPATGLGTVYSMVGTAGAWALRRGCVFASTDKGMGPAFEDVTSGTVMAYDGTTGPRAAIGERAAFTAQLTPQERTRLAGRVVYKTAHNGTNPQASWGRDVLRSVELAFTLLNRHHRREFTPENTTVLVTGVSNGGGAAIAAGEEDRHGLVDAVVAAEPQLNLRGPVDVREGERHVPAAGLPLLKYYAVASLLQPCAALTEPTAPGYAALDQPAAWRRCAELVGDDPRFITQRDAPREELPRLAQEALVRIGFQPASSYLQASHYDPQTPLSYAMSFARASAADSLCGYGWARVDVTGRPMPYQRAELASAFVTSAGRAPAPGVLVDENAPGGPAADGRHGYNLRGERCVLGLAFPAGQRSWARRVQEGLDATRRSGDLHGKPALIVHGRDDARVPVNHSSRPYLGLNSLTGHASVSYVEITNAHHSDSTAPGFDTRYVPLGLYYQQALDVMWRHLREGAPLPPSQVVRTVPRGGEPGKAPALTAGNVPPMTVSPAPGDRIRVTGGVVRMPAA